MAINPIPVTFHLQAEDRPVFDAARRRRARPYRAVIHGVLALCALGLGVGYYASGAVRPLQGTMAAAPVASPPAVAQRQPSAVMARAPRPVQDIEVDRTPVGSITRETGRAPRGAFAPLVRAPDYQGFAVTAGR